MALNIKNAEVERLAGELARLTGESKTETIRRALRERRDRLALRSPDRPRGAEFLRYLEEAVWPKVPEGTPLTKQQREEILGYGPEGV
jgi:antitoxin VapB